MGKSVFETQIHFFSQTHILSPFSNWEKERITQGKYDNWKKEEPAKKWLNIIILMITYLFSELFGNLQTDTAVSRLRDWLSANQGAVFRSCDWLSANQGAVFSGPVSCCTNLFSEPFSDLQPNTTVSIINLSLLFVHQYRICVVYLFELWGKRELERELESGNWCLNCWERGGVVYPFELWGERELEIGGWGEIVWLESGNVRRERIRGWDMRPKELESGTWVESREEI